MPDFVPIQDLTIAGSVADNDLFPMSDGSGAYAVRGSTIKSYAASDAQAAAADAALSKTAAQNAADAAALSQSAAEDAVTTAASAVATAEGAVAQVSSLQNTPINADMIKTEFAPTLVSGYFNSTTGASASSSGKYVRTSALWNGNGTRSAILLDSTNYKYYATYYDSTGTTSGTGFLGSSRNAPGLWYIPEAAKLFGLSICRVDGSNMTDSDITAVLAVLYALVPTDTSLTERGKAADGRTVGSKLEWLRQNQYAGNAKNVLDFADLATASSAGRKWSVNADRSITVSGTPSGNSVFSVFYNTSAVPDWITKGKTYYVVFDDPDIYYVVSYREDGAWHELISEGHTSRSFTVPDRDTVVGFAFRLWIDYTTHPEAINKTFRIFAFDEMPNKQLLSQITSVTDARFNQLRYAQYAGNAKNIVDDATLSTANSGGRKWTVNADRSITVSGTPNALSIYSIYYNQSVFPEWVQKGKNYYVIFADDDIYYSIGYRKNGAWTNLIEQAYTSKSFRVPIDDDITGLFIRLYIDYTEHPEAINKTIRFFVFDQKPNSVLAQETSGGSVGIPEHWQSYMEDKIQTIQQADIIHHTGDSFVFTTDNHWEKNTGNSGALARYITQNSSVKKIICGGDLITYHADKQIALDVINAMMRAYGDPFVACGNHDDNGESTEAGTEELLPILQRYGAITRRFNEKIHPFRTGGNTYTYYTIINDADMFAYLVMDATDYNYSQTQLNWLTDQLTALYQTYNIVIITHMHSASDGTVLTNTGGVLETLLDGLDSAIVDKIIAIFAGHIHRDRVYRTSTGIPIIITKCDTWQQEHDDDMVPGTTTEQAFDVVHIDLDSSTIYLTRIGSGQDRTVPFREAST